MKSSKNPRKKVTRCPVKVAKSLLLSEDCQKNIVGRVLLSEKQDSAFFCGKKISKVLKQDYPTWM
ncbi:hypothetical protein [Methanosarcina barkeri]|uniref:hypothetical protein n=1 Tax=Methanosarcina barkeri TaxID=2208 RepID=UPI00064F2CD2|nr:hypothetical protein [Methanosarcina barkeri]